MNPEIREYYLAKAEEAELNAMKASTPTERESWMKIAQGYRVLTGESGVRPIPQRRVGKVGIF
jgi:hypothetical protein